MRRDKSILFSRITFLSLISISLLALNNLFIESLSKGIGIYAGLFNVTLFTQSFNIFIFIISGIIITLTGFYPRKSINFNIHNFFSNKEGHNGPWSLFSLWSRKGYNDISSLIGKQGEQFTIIEYPLIIVFILCGGVFLMSSADLISIFLSIELQSYGLYILSTIYRNSESSTKSGLTYFLLGGLSSCFILLGSALLYANSGTSYLDNLYIITSMSDISLSGLTTYLYEANYLHLSLLILFVGFLFKVSAAPFHFWSPDVYDGIPTIVTTYVAIVAKISLFAFFLELVYYTEYSFFDFSLKNILILSSLFSLIIGSILGLTQFRIKRLFAYSTISHVGFILLALSINTTESIQSYIFYILQYSISNLNAFIILLAIGYSLFLYSYKEKNKEQASNLIDANNSPIQLIEQIKGYFYVNAFLAISLSITIFSFVGIPPIIGFFAKQMILSAALDSGYVFMSLIAILTSVIGAAYYLNLIKQIFFYKENYKKANTAPNLWHDYFNTSYHVINYFSANYSLHDMKKKKIKSKDLTLNSMLSISVSIITLLLLLFIFMPQEWFNIVNILCLSIFKA
jgi:NADH-ubiquinone oxidoreductase chain 2